MRCSDSPTLNNAREDQTRRRPSPSMAGPAPSPSRVRGGWTSAGILSLVLATAAVAGWAVSWWIVPPYVALMAWLLLPAEDRDQAQTERPSRAGPVPPAPTIPVEPASASASAAEPEPIAESSTTRPARTRKPRTRSKPREKESPPTAPEPMQVNWVQVAPGKFVRVESPQLPTADEPAPAAIEVEQESLPTPNADDGPPPAPPPDDGPDQHEPKNTLPNEAPDHDDPGPGDDPEPEPGPRSPEEHHDAPLGFAEDREPGGEDAAINPTEPVGAAEAEPGPTAEATPPQEGPSACPSDANPGVAGIAPDASGGTAGRAPARPAAPNLSPLRVDGWPGRLLDDRAGRTRGPIVDSPPLPTPRLDRGRSPDPGRLHGRPRHDRPFHPTPPRKHPTRGPPR